MDLDWLPVDVTAQPEQMIGNEFNYDSLVYYGFLTGKTGSLGSLKIRVLANGGCFTGFGLDVFAQAKATEIKAGVDCLAGDWLIFEMLGNQVPDRCLPVEKVSQLGFDVITLEGRMSTSSESKVCFS